MQDRLKFTQLPKIFGMAQASASGAATGNATGSPRKLLNQVRERTRVMHYSIRTEQVYPDWARRFILFHGKRHPKDMGAAEVAAVLTHLAVERGVSASKHNQAKAALSQQGPHDGAARKPPAAAARTDRARACCIARVLTRAWAQSGSPNALAVKYPNARQKLGLAVRVPEPGALHRSADMSGRRRLAGGFRSMKRCAPSMGANLWGASPLWEYRDRKSVV